MAVSESRTRAHIAALLSLLLAVIVTVYLLGIVLPDHPWVHVPLHAVVEAVGVLAAFLLAGLILQLPAGRPGDGERRVWAACGLIAVGVLDLFHAVVPPGNLFVWLHSMSLLGGGLLFVLVWWPLRNPPRGYALPLVTALSVGALCILSIRFADALPAMHTDAGFTRTAVWVNVLGGALLLFAAVRFLLGYAAHRQGEDLMFAALILLFALSGGLFEYSRLWNADWWLWHGVRLIAYLLAAAFVLLLFRRVQRNLAHANRSLAAEVGERRRVEENLIRRGEELQRMNAELEEFAYVASHDLKAPLRAVANLALVIDEDAGPCLDQENRRRLGLMRKRVQGMDALIEGLLHYARLGRNQERRVPVALAPLLREVLETIPLEAGFRVEVSEPLPTLVAAPSDLRQIFQNLIGNAAAHHDRPDGRVWIRAREAADACFIEVADDGPGIPAGARERVFRMFSSSGKVGHSGIGLAVVRKLVLANGAAIEVDERPPRGALFRIRWPMTPP